MIWTALERYRDLGLLVLRLGFGIAFVFYHGWAKLVGGPERWEAVGGAMSHVGIDFGHTFFGFLASFAESIGGILFAAGLLFRPMCLLIALTMTVAAMNHIASGQGTPAHAFKNGFVALGMMLVGPGRYSLDHYLKERIGKRDPVDGSQRP